MEIPKTTSEKPYIQFKITKTGKVKLSTSGSWWGGKNSGFISSDGSMGNTCKPKQLKSHFEAFKKKQIERYEKEIVQLQKKIEKIKSVTL